MADVVVVEEQEKMSLGIEPLYIMERKVSSKEGLIKGIHLVGFKSSNVVKGNREPYSYTEDALKKATPLYKGVKVYSNHQKRTDDKEDRALETQVGFVAESYYIEGKGIVGDIQYNPKGKFYESIVWWAENAPSKLGMSHIADVEFSRPKNAVIAITKVDSVDMVTNPSTTKALFTEGILSDQIDLNEAARKLQTTLDVAWSMCYKFMYPLEKTLTQEEKATSIIPVIQDLLKELKTFNTTVAESKTSKDDQMEIKDLTLDDIKTKRPELFKAIESAAVTDAFKKDAELTGKVNEALKDLHADLKTPVFVKQVRESIEAGREVTDLIEDRKALQKVVVTSRASGSSATEEQKVSESKKSEKKALTDAEFIEASK